MSRKRTCSALQLHNAAIIACGGETCGELTADTGKYFLDIEKSSGCKRAFVQVPRPAVSVNTLSKRLPNVKNLMA